MTPEVLLKLEQAFAVGASDLEACFYADISKSALYNYQNDNPEFVERKEKLKERPVLLARQTVVKALASDSGLAMNFLTRKAKREFSERIETDITSNDQTVTSVDVMEIATEAARILKEKKTQ